LLVDSEVTNQYGGTFYRFNLQTELIIDLAFYTGFQQIQWSNWHYAEATGSDYETIAFRAVNTGPSKPYQGSIGYNLKKANWKGFKQSLQALETKATEDFDRAIQLQEYDTIATVLQEVITTAAQHTISKSRPYKHFKPWWTTELNTAWKSCNRALRLYKQSCTTELERTWKETRKAYFTAIRTAKTEHWNQFLEGLQGLDTFAVQRYTKLKNLGKIPVIEYTENGTLKQAKTFEEKSTAFFIALFPKPVMQALRQSSNGSNSSNRPTTTATTITATATTSQWEWLDLATIEIQQAIQSSSGKKALGPDQIGFTIIQQAYNTIPTVFNKAYKALFEAGHQPTSWKTSIGIIILKPLKPSYSTPKAYRVISLLNCLGKVLEKIFATRLGYLANTTGLLHFTQLGGRKQRSAIDAVMLLLNEIQH
jgi:hypothetical protein